MESLENDEQVESIVARLAQFARGDYHQPPLVVHPGRGLDAIVQAVNDLGKKLDERGEKADLRRERMQQVLNAMMRYTQPDFGIRTETSLKDDEIDELSAGLDALGEEVVQHINRLKDSEAQLGAIFHDAPDPVVVVDSSDVILRWNAAAARSFGWAPEEVAGRFLHETLVPHAYRDRHVSGIQRFLKTGKGRILNRTLEFPAHCKDGSEVPVELTVSPAKVNGEYWFIGFLRDISKRKKAEQKVLQLNATLEQRVNERTEDLRVSEQKYRHLFENNPIPLWVIDIETLGFLDVNESAVRQYGYTREEFLSMTSLDIRPESDRPNYLELNRTKRGTQNMGVWRHLRKDGTMIYADIIVHEMTFGGRPARLVLSNDVTEMTKTMRELRLSEARFRRVFDSKMTGFFFWREDGTITGANDLFLEMTGYSRADLEAGRLNLTTMVPPEYEALRSDALAQIRTEGVCEPFEKEYFRKDGSRLPVLVAAASMSDEEALQCVTCVMDVSQRRAMQEEIRNLNRDLEARIVERTRELEEANRELESFSYTVSHDLRAPLRAIHGYSQMLVEDHGPKLDEEAARLIHLVRYNARRMGQLVDDLLAFSRLGKRTMTPEMIDVTELVNDVMNDFPDRERVKVTLHSLGSAEADPTFLRQAFQNLVSNALKYSSKKERPEVEIGVQDVDGERVYFVRDNGAGFDMRYYNKMFGVFERLHHQDEFEGTGVGLAIVQRIVQRHGGRIWAEGKVGEGAAFYFTLEGRPAPDSGLGTETVGLQEER